jgi:glycine cleavage system aminomethyltransferase T
MRSPLYAIHALAGATFAEEGGWEVPTAYRQPAAERQAIREGLAICDITARAKVDLRGPIDDILGKLAQAERYLIARLSGRWALLLSAPGSQEGSLRAATDAAGDRGLATDATCIYAGFGLTGPRSLALIERISPFDTRTLPAEQGTGIQALKVPSVLVRRTAPPGCFELYVACEYGRYAWESLLRLGMSLDIAPVGWNAFRAEGWR